MIEKLADYSHEAWSGWMRYMFAQGTFSIDGTWQMPKEKVERWTRQMNTPYEQLGESEKKSDRAEANKIVAIIES